MDEKTALEKAVAKYPYDPLVREVPPPKLVRLLQGPRPTSRSLILKNTYLVHSSVGDFHPPTRIKTEDKYFLRRREDQHGVTHYYWRLYSRALGYWTTTANSRTHRMSKEVLFADELYSLPRRKRFKLPRAWVTSPYPSKPKSDPPKKPQLSRRERLIKKGLFKRPRKPAPPVLQ